MRAWHTILLLPVLVASTATGRCRPAQASSRKDWYVLHPSLHIQANIPRDDLSTQERTDYIDAVWCLRGRPAVLPNDQYPGVRDRHDDFVATHINYTLNIHNDGLLLPWHRHFTYLYEKALQDECDYQGTVPYWNWPTTTNLTASPVFDGSPTSFSGNGLPQNNTSNLCPLNITPCPSPGTGGGCVTTGPFSNWSMHLGPFSLSQVIPYGDLPANAFAYNPRCLTRNFTTDWLAALNTQDKVDDMLAATDIEGFLELMSPSANGYAGAHEGGHASVGANMLDTFASAQDPVFFLHHAMVDRVWTLWQLGDWDARKDALNGTTVVHNPPGAPEVTLDTVMEFGVLDEPRRVEEVMDVFGGDYCYRYD
ncbi:hypothetical protein AnigIFM63326_000995 [Aspergillus niger]|nr:hypothetical protein AnigIFM63326_000995 [Aspergillus niger]